jgi:biotin carboxyl carrier protein
LASVIPTRYFLGRPDIGEEMHISIEKGKTLIIRLMAVGPVVEGRAQRDVWFEVNGEVRPAKAHSLVRTDSILPQVRAVSVEDKNSAVETVSREKATNDPGSVGAPMSGVVVEVRVKEGQEIKKGDPLAGMCYHFPRVLKLTVLRVVLSAMKASIHSSTRLYQVVDDHHRWSRLLPHQCQDTSNVWLCRKVSIGLSFLP